MRWILAVLSAKVNLARLPGWEPESWGYHGDDGFSFECTPSGKSYGPKYGFKDVVGCGVNFRKGTAFFTKNGVFLGDCFSNIKTENLYPAVGLKRASEHIFTNFGKTPFVFDIDALVEKERRQVLDEIAKQDTSSLQLFPFSAGKQMTETSLARRLVSQYLAHEGYVETSRAFQQEVDVSDQPLREIRLAGDATDNGLAEIRKRRREEADASAVNRQKVRRAILDGDIDSAIDLTNTLYPTVLRDERNKDVYFRLRCRKFIEMMKRYSDLLKVTSASATKNTTESIGNGYRPDTQMELDDQLHREASSGLSLSATASSKRPIAHDLSSKDDEEEDEDSGDEEEEDEEERGDEDEDEDDDMDLPPIAKLYSPSTSLKQEALLHQAIEYGTALRTEFQKDTRAEVRRRLNDIFAIMAYTDPADSVVGKQLLPNGRVEIAEEVNGAILVSLGKPASAAIEKIGAWTEALLDEVAAKTGGTTALVSVEHDFLGQAGRTASERSNNA